MTKNPISAIARVRRTHTIKLRVTVQELAVIREHSANTAIAVYIREQLFGGVVVTTKQHHRKKPARNGQDAGCAALARQVAMIGNNINQLARIANMAMKDCKPFDSVIFAIRLYSIWEELHVLQSIQSGKWQGSRHRLSNESEGCEWTDEISSSKTYAR